ncbi:tail fiber assembly protein [Escherichia sp. E1130]|uniref:tail fiber assembly protein n=1 Tax=Escherichia sp. E1130 TaxID=2041645 RepID=UPI0010822DCB|nr:tail fiber assembly protein [Escherichia sp. E1130]TGC22594.1 tail fiber assembly protein [Escherichia sp. E1130]TLI74046.1 tail fiber assembly protein [Escherichia sp. E1130]
MNKYLYDSKTNAFYPFILKADYEHSDTWPESGVAVGEDVFLEFVRVNPEKVRVAGEDGMPVWADAPEPTPEQIIDSATCEKQRRIDDVNDYINNKQWPGKAVIGRLKGEELAQYNLWLDYLDALGIVDTSSAPDIEWPMPPASAER